MIDDLELARTLLEQGVANRDQLRQARQLQLTQETTLYLAMIDHDIIEESAIVEIAASLLNVPFVTLADRQVDPSVARLIPADMAREHGVLPLELREDAQGRLLLLAMRDPLDIMAMDDISTHVNVGIQPILCGPRDLMQAIERMQAPPMMLSMERNNSVDFGEFRTSPEPESEPDSITSEDSWADFFDDALSQPEPSSGLEMRDRASTMALDLMDIDEILDDEHSHKDPVSLLDEPGEPSSAELSGLNGWEVDSSLSPPKPPPPLPRTVVKQDAEQGETSFDELYAAIDDDLKGSDPAPSGTFIANPSASLTGEHDAEEIKQSIEAAKRREREARSGPHLFGESEIIGEAPSLVSVVSDVEEDYPEPVISDEAGSQTQMGSLGLMLADESEIQESRGVTHERAHLSLNQERGSLTTLGTPKRLNPDGTERPMLVIKSDGEDLFSQALADIDALDGDVVGNDRGDEPPVVESAVTASTDDPSAALGRLKLKRVAVPRHGLLDAPIIEKSRIVAQQEEVISEKASPSPVPTASQANPPAARDILEDDDILAGFQAALDDDDDDDEDVRPVPMGSGASQGHDPLDATREFDASEFFGLGSDDGLDEATNAAIGEAHARIERLNSMIRSANHHASAEHQEELGAQGTDGEIDAPAAGMRVVQPTRSNQALTRDSLVKMRQSTMDLSSELLFSGTNSPGLPQEVDDSRLLRAALMILISQDLIKIDELIALAKSLPSQDS